MNKHEIFNKVGLHLLTQNMRAINDDQCAYRAEQDDGTVLKCAVGCLIDDAHYSPFVENVGIAGLRLVDKTAGGIRLGNMLEASGIELTGENLELMADLQGLHDNNDEIFWSPLLALVAEKHHINIDDDLHALILKKWPEIIDYDDFEEAFPDHKFLESTGTGNRKHVRYSNGLAEGWPNESEWFDDTTNELIDGSKAA